ncbi:DUF6233 domain-containing protein [Streptomyces sp. LN699]|uniref:DUF6233 domain-containing protein n=1 Tax=Streptomyces sp. LN699 TaxID=3112981 RepID=UPI0037203992
MSDLPPDLARLRTVVTYLRAALGRAEQALAVAETQASLDAARRPMPDPPAWLIEHGIGAGRPLIRVHVGGCWDTRNRCSPIDVEQARRALAEGVPGCPHCRPHIALGVLD